MLARGAGGTVAKAGSQKCESALVLDGSEHNFFRQLIKHQKGSKMSQASSKKIINWSLDRKPELADRSHKLVQAKLHQEISPEAWDIDGNLNLSLKKLASGRCSRQPITENTNRADPLGPKSSRQKERLGDRLLAFDRLLAAHKQGQSSDKRRKIKELIAFARELEQETAFSKNTQVVGFARDQKHYHEKINTEMKKRIEELELELYWANARTGHELAGATAAGTSRANSPRSKQSVDSKDSRSHRRRNIAQTGSTDKKPSKTLNAGEIALLSSRLSANQKCCTKPYCIGCKGVPTLTTSRVNSVSIDDKVTMSQISVNDFFQASLRKNQASDYSPSKKSENRGKPTTSKMSLKSPPPVLLEKKSTIQDDESSSSLESVSSKSDTFDPARATTAAAAIGQTISSGGSASEKPQQKIGFGVNSLVDAEPEHFNGVDKEMKRLMESIAARMTNMQMVENEIHKKTRTIRNSIVGFDASRLQLQLMVSSVQKGFGDLSLLQTHQQQQSDKHEVRQQLQQEMREFNAEVSLEVAKVALSVGQLPQVLHQPPSHP